MGPKKGQNGKISKIQGFVQKIKKIEANYDSIKILTFNSTSVESTTSKCPSVSLTFPISHNRIAYMHTWRKNFFTHPTPLLPCPLFRYFGLFQSELWGSALEPYEGFWLCFFCVFGTSENFSGGLYFCLALFSFLGPGEGLKVAIF